MEHSSPDADFEKVKLTALLVAYRRTFTDIPYSRDIFEKLTSLWKSSFEEIPSDLKKPELAPQFEARHKLIDKLIYQSGIHQILELASGFSSRGLVMSKEQGFNYVELDLPSVIKEKESVIEELARDGGFPVPRNLHFEPGNVLDFRTFENAIRHFDESAPVAIMNEGLLRYLTFDEKADVAKNIRDTLGRFPGVWITSDVSLRKIFSVENRLMSGYVEKISKLTGKDIAGNRFETEQQARDFFENFGFSIERHSFVEVRGELVSPAILNLSEDQVRDLIEDAVVFVMKSSHSPAVKASLTI